MIPPGLTVLSRVTVQLVVVLVPKMARLLSDQVTSAASFHQLLVVVSQLPLPSCGPVVEPSASQVKALALGVMVTQFVTLEPE